MTPATPRLRRPADAPRPSWKPALRLWDRLSIYLPVLMMGALALGTYWLVRNSPVFSAPEAAREAQHESDYFMRRFTIKTFDDNGQFKSEVAGIEARHYADTDTLEIDDAHMRSVSSKGQLVTSTSRRALANGDGSEVQLLGNARVVREAGKDSDGNEQPRMEFQGEFLDVFVKDERVASHKPVMLTRGGDQFSGETFAYDSLTGIAELKGRVKGLLVSRTAPSPAR